MISIRSAGVSAARYTGVLGLPAGTGGAVVTCREGWTRVLTINVALLLIIVVVLRLRRRTQARSRLDEQASVVIVLALGVLLAPTQFGHGLLHFMDGLAHSVSQIHI